MKPALLILSPILLLFVFVWNGCAGTPMGWERGFYQIKTNWFTNDMPFLDVQGQGTNRTTNIVYKTVVQPGYDYERREDVEAYIRAGGAATSASGVPWGGVIAPVLIGILGIWARIRENKANKTAGVFAQTIETSREVLKVLPGGAKLEADMMEIAKANQRTAGVKTLAEEIVQANVDKDAAKQTANLIARPLVAGLSAPRRDI